MKVEYYNSCEDGFDKEWGEEYRRERKEDGWYGTIEIKEKSENCICADVNCRGSNFIVVLSRYYKPNEELKKMGITDSWCLCIPNWNVGIVLDYLSKYEIFLKVNEKINNKVDSISVVNAIWNLSEDIRKKYNEVVRMALK